jgi:hypothetical protein
MRSAELVGWALGGLEREIESTRSRLASLTIQANKLRRRLGRTAVAAVESAGEATGRRRRRMSPDARRRISEMMKKRWAERKRKGTGK